MVNTAVAVAGNGGVAGGRASRLPRWTRQEILVLIEGKHEVERRGRRGGGRAAAEPKWAAVAAFCRLRGVERGPVQCRKRWSNLAGDYKKIREWEKAKGSSQSFWLTRNDARRERKLPGFFDREIYEILEGGKKEGEVVFDSRRPVIEDGLFSDSEETEEDEKVEEDYENSRAAIVAETVVVVPPISEYKPIQLDGSEPGAAGELHLQFLRRASTVREGGGSVGNDKQPADDDADNGGGSSSREATKRRRTSSEDGGDGELQRRLIEALDRSGRMVEAQLEAQNMSSQLDRGQRKCEAEGLLAVLNKLADAMGRIADKL